jgi:transcriptional regulator with XRE-family HTH domain
MKHPIAATISHNLRRFRGRRGMSQAAVAEEAGIATEAYGRLERGQAVPGADTLIDLAAALDVSAADLLAADPNVTSDKPLKAAEPGSHYGSSPDLERIMRELARWPRPLLRRLAPLLEALRKGFSLTSSQAARSDQVVEARHTRKRPTRRGRRGSG